ncbi:MAG: hypothetical protein ACF8R7_18620 [Phycisphaerales bacterium JB039]
MSHYLVKARPIPEKLAELRARIAHGEIVKMIPFGRGLHNSLSDARLDERGWALWEELDFCTPPLKIEREAVLDEYFESFKVEPVEQGEGWAQIRTLPRLLHSEIPVPKARKAATSPPGGARKKAARKAGRKTAPRRAE